MTALLDNSRTITLLEELMDRLCAPDLTIAESRRLRPRLWELLESNAAARASLHRPEHELTDASTTERREGGSRPDGS